MYTKSEKIIVTVSVMISLIMMSSFNAGAMHIMEGYLSVGFSVMWGIVCLPFIIMAVISLKKKLADEPRALVLLALCGAFAFVLSALKIPSVTGSCSHPTGVGLGAVMFGPFAMSLISLIVLLFQALLLGHGGITTLGANTFSMGIAGPIVSFAAYKLLKKLNVPVSVSVFAAAFLGNLFTYVVTAVQLSVAYPENGSVLKSLVEFLSIFALTQIPLAVIEGLLTVVIFGIIEKYSKKQLVSLRVI